MFSSPANIMCRRAKAAVGLFISALLIGHAAAFEPLALQGDTASHDPSTIVRDGALYYDFCTGPGIRVKVSADLVHWTNSHAVFTAAPAWTTNIVPGFNGYIWAPDIVQVSNKFLLYYSVSSWGKQDSAIGLATSPTLDPAATNHLWTDHGPVLRSSKGSPFNAIDPSAFLDRDGKLWLAFGSYWQGIYLTELDPCTGLRAGTNSPLHRLAWNNSIEAACLTHHGDFYYLFVNWGQCCRGTNSTYEVRVGRSKTITGPYRDRDGMDLASGGGTPFLKSDGRFIGPGHIGVFTDHGTDWFSYHYYDTEAHGRSRLALGKLDWHDGWPMPAK